MFSIKMSEIIIWGIWIIIWQTPIFRTASAQQKSHESLETWLIVLVIIGNRKVKKVSQSPQSFAALCASLR